MRLRNGLSRALDGSHCARVAALRATLLEENGVAEQHGLTRER